MNFKFVCCFLFILISSAYAEEDEYPKICPNIVSRHMWGGENPKEVNYQIIPVKYVIIQHTATPSCTTPTSCSERVLSIQNYHMNELGFHDIGLNFLIGEDGEVYEGCGWHKIGAHTRGYNSIGLGIAFIGTFTDKLPAEKALTAAKNLLACGVELGELDANYKMLAHKQVSATLSPGLALYREIITWPHWTSRVKKSS